METAGGSSRDPLPDPKQQVAGEKHGATERLLSCPKCGSSDVRRSHHQGTLSAVLRTLGRWPFRCRSCRSRFYRAAPPADE